MRNANFLGYIQPIALAYYWVYTVGAIIIWSLANFVGLPKNGTVYNFNHRYILTLRDRISQKNPE